MNFQAQGLKKLNCSPIVMNLMAKDSLTQSRDENELNAPNASSKNATWLPILSGVLCGMIVLCLFAKDEPPFFYHFTAWLFNEDSPAKIIEPRTIHFSLYMLTLAGAGGIVGVLFSEWRRKKAILFLLAILVIIAAFNALGNQLESVWQ